MTILNTVAFQTSPGGDLQLTLPVNRGFSIPTTSVIQFGEGATGPVIGSGLDVLWGDSVSHRLLMSNNNRSPDQVVGANTTDILANKTLSSPAITGTPTGSALQGSDPKILTTDRTGSTGDVWIRDANGGATSGGAFPIVKTAKNTSICKANGSAHSLSRYGATATWSGVFVDNNYFVACSGIAPSDPTNNPENGRAYIQVLSHSASSVTLTL